MFDIGMQELIIIFIVALIVFGPKKLPELAKSLGRAVGEVKRAVYGLSRHIDEPVASFKDFEKMADLSYVNTLTPNKAAEQNQDQGETRAESPLQSENDSISDAQLDEKQQR
jgi:TatA/E family protein of Tat protein translocase